MDNDKYEYCKQKGEDVRARCGAGVLLVWFCIQNDPNYDQYVQ